MTPYFHLLHTLPSSSLHTVASLISNILIIFPLSQRKSSTMVVKMASLFHVFFLFLLTVVTQNSNSAEILTVYSTSNLNVPSMAASVDNQDLPHVANTVLMAETWLRSHVLSFYPTFNTTHIVVGHNLLCSSKTNLHFHHLILPALENIHHSLVRWGLNSEIKVSPSFSSHCLEDLSSDFTVSVLKPLLPFLHSTNSSYMVNPPPETVISGKKIESLVSTHFNFLKKIGFLSTESPNFMVVKTQTTNEAKPTMRKLNYILPTPSPEEQPIAKGPNGLPPLIGVGPTISPPSPVTGPPHLGITPTHSPHPHHHPHHNLPPCNPGPPQAAPEPGFEPRRESLWCVAKPSVPAETLQEAMDYACGEGGAECDEIQPNGNCYYPDSLFNHASYAFNNYWQKTKINGGTCNFGGTAMLINSDPSFLHCRFILV